MLRWSEWAFEGPKIRAQSSAPRKAINEWPAQLYCNTALYRLSEEVRPRIGRRRPAIVVTTPCSGRWREGRQAGQHAALGYWTTRVGVHAVHEGPQAQYAPRPNKRNRRGLQLPPPGAPAPARSKWTASRHLAHTAASAAQLRSAHLLARPLLHALDKRGHATEMRQKGVDELLQKRRANQQRGRLSAVRLCQEGVDRLLQKRRAQTLQRGRLTDRPGCGVPAVHSNRLLDHPALPTCAAPTLIPSPPEPCARPKAVSP